MSYVANQYNYATPLSSSPGFNSEYYTVNLRNYFTLANNVLDGSFQPIEGDVGLWGNVLSDSNGALPQPFIVTVTGNAYINALRVIGSPRNYPVDFHIEVLNGSTILDVISVVGNTEIEYIRYLPRMLHANSYRVVVTKISAANEVARLYNVYNPGYVKRAETLSVRANEVGVSSELLEKASTDALRVDTEHTTHIENHISTTHDALRLAAQDNVTLTNVHTKMKEPSRRIYGKVYITYTDPMRVIETSVRASSVAYNSDPEQALDSNTEVTHKYFTLYDNDLSGSYALSGPSDQVGWVSGELSNEDGYFAEPYPFISVDVSERPVVKLPITFDDSHGSIAEDFTVTFTTLSGTKVVKTFVGNTSKTVVIEEAVADVTNILITVTKVTKPGYPVGIIEINVMSTILYVGYQDTSNLISIDLLEELTYEDEVEALGGVSANEVTIRLDNSAKEFYFNNPDSLVASALKRNRKIVPWLGVEVIPGEIEWYTLGTFWSYSWNVPVESLHADVIGFDTIGLLDTTSFTNHQVQVNRSIGQLIEYVLEDAKTQLDFIDYKIDSALYDIVVPYAWFAASSHTAALRKISGCYPMHIYCDRDGNICAAPQKLHLDYYYDTWADNTNVISKSYSSLFTTLPNIINVTVKNLSVLSAEELTKDELVFDVSQVPSRTLNFSKPYISDIVVTIDCDNTVQYTYTVYSWGIEILFTGSGEVRSIVCSGAALDTSRTAVISHRDERSIRLNGAVTRDIQSDFIQTSSLASELIQRLLSLSEYDKFDATVDYRGDIALTINDPILLLNGIAPDNRYNIKRHELSWNGALTGAAYLNT